jgi:hypothetical protein
VTYIITTFDDGEEVITLKWYVNLQTNININDVIIGFDDNNWWWGGRISNTKIYNSSLMPQEIQQNYNATKGRYGL